MSLKFDKMSEQLKELTNKYKHAEYMFSSIQELLKNHLDNTGKELYLPGEEFKNDYAIERFLELSYYFIRGKVNLDIKIEEEVQSDIF